MQYTYDITLDAPLGQKCGILVLSAITGEFRGVLSLMTFHNPVYGAANSGGECTLMGRMRTLMQNLPFTAEGKIHPDGLELTVHWDGKNYPLHGKIKGV